MKRYLDPFQRLVVVVNAHLNKTGLMQTKKKRALLHFTANRVGSEPLREADWESCSVRAFWGPLAGYIPISKIAKLRLAKHKNPLHCLVATAG